MQTLILPGYSSKDKEWVDETSKNLKVDGIVRPFHWAHWLDENSKFDVKEKAELIAKHIKGDKVTIIAKDEGLEVADILKTLIPDLILSISSK